MAQQWDFPRLGVSHAACPSERDSSRQLAPQSMAIESESNSPTYEVQLAITDADIENTAMSSASPSTDKDVRSQDVSLVLPSTSERDISDQDMSLVLSPALQRDIPSHGLSVATPQASERLYVSRASQWNESSPATSQRSDCIPPTSERSHVSASQMNVNISTASQRADTASTALKSDGIYLSVSHKIDDLAQRSQGSDNISPVSHRMDATVHSTSERAYILAASSMSKSVGETFERSDPMFPTSERIYMPATSHRNDHIGSTSHRTDIERVYIPSASHHRNESIGQASQLGDALTPTSERAFLPPMVQNMPPSSERLYVPTNSQRMYNQNPIISMDEFPSQAAAMTLPSSQRI